MPQGEQVNVIWYSGCAGRGWVFGEEVRSVRGLAAVSGEGSEEEGRYKGFEVVELKRRKEVESGWIRGKGLCCGRARSVREVFETRGA